MLDIRKACSAGIVSAAADRRSPHQEQAGASPSFMPAASPRRQPPVIRCRDRRRADGRPHSARRYPGPGPSSAARTRALQACEAYAPRDTPPVPPLDRGPSLAPPPRTGAPQPRSMVGASPSFMPAAVPAPAARGPAAVCAWDWFGELAGEVRHGLSYCNVTST
jgi:hypothetical protein